MTRDPWKLVTDEAQLKVGMTVELRQCGWCGKRERFMLLRSRKPKRFSVGPDGERLETTAVAAWFYSNRCREYVKSWPEKAGVLDYTIRERRLYALIDDDTAADETTVTRRREMV